MKWFDNLSYIRKLTLSSMLSSLLAVLAVLLVIGIVTFNTARNEMVKNLQTTARIVGASASAAILTNNSVAAINYLENFKSHPDVIDAIIFLPQQTGIFVEYHNQAYAEHEHPVGMGFQQNSMAPAISGSDIYISEPVIAGSEIVGSIFIRSSIQPLIDKAKLIVLLSLLSLVFAVLVSMLILRMTKNIWAEPFLRFSRTIRMITQDKDYSRRLRTTKNDEFGGLISGFNAMLEQIDSQQVQLKTQQTDLEHEVEARTQEITRANRKLISEIAERSKSEMELQKLTSAVTQAEEAVIITDYDGFIEYVNPSFERISGYTKEQAIGKKPNILRSETHDEDFYSDLWNTLLDDKVYKGVFVNARPNGDIYHLEQSITPVRNDYGKLTHFVATGRDISERIEAEVALQHMAHHDALTGLPNRSLLTDRIGHAIQRASRENSEVAVMFLDLDGFKLANDIYGHEAGDIVLKTVANRLRSTVRTPDTVARISGDEFAVVLEDIHSVADAGIVARKLLDVLSASYIINDNEIFVTASIGISIYPIDGTDTRNLLKHSDQAMYKAKRSGKGRYSFYSAEENDFDTQRLEIEQNLIRAVKEKQFILYYQPLMRTDEKGIYGAEALIRWQHPTKGIIMPDRFIPSLEDSGMINEVGAWVMDEACRQLAVWNEKGQTDLVMSVNVSPRQLNDNEFINYLVNALQTSGIRPDCLELEITERMFLAFNDQNVRTLNRVADLGVRIAVDDFGMGYSSLSYISKLRINTLKIDRSFISELTDNQGDAKIVSALIGLGERLNIDVTAEGVETREQLELLGKMHCNFAQGYLWARPMPPKDFDNWHIGSTQKMAILLDQQSA